VSYFIVCLQSIETAEGVAFLHSVNPPVLHRDLRSANILLDSTGHVKVGSREITQPVVSKQ